jgi:hypothetical protein
MNTSSLPPHSVRSRTPAPAIFGRDTFADGATIEPGDVRRAEIEAFVAQVYRARYGAELTTFLQHLLAWRNAAGSVQAAVGLRGGSEGRLFVEQYLDAPAEIAIAATVGRPVRRERLVEVGNFGARSAGDTRELILHLTHALHAAGFRWVLFAATRQLRNAFERMHMFPIPLADAQASRLAGDGTDWGRYYDTQPKLVCGEIALGHEWLRRHARAPDITPPLAFAGTGGFSP